LPAAASSAAFSAATTSNVRAFALLLAAATAAPAAATVWLDELTSTELRERIASGAVTTALVPVGGTEQNGPHLVLGKHNRRVAVLAERIAQRVGRTVVAPVLAYVPEGAIAPPTQHMRWSGTISVPVAAFEGVLEGAARSLCQHGLQDVFFVGDHGGYQASLERVAARSSRESAGRRCRVHALAEYYRVTQTDYVQALKARGHDAAAIGSHAGLADTALALAVDPALVRADVAAKRAPATADGVSGDPRAASAELGRLGSERIVEASAAAIRALQQHGATTDKDSKR
jgi:creatinine amidohydrolase